MTNLKPLSDMLALTLASRKARQADLAAQASAAGARTFTAQPSHPGPVFDPALTGPSYAIPGASIAAWAVGRAAR